MLIHYPKEILILSIVPMMYVFDDLIHVLSKERKELLIHVIDPINRILLFIKCVKILLTFDVYLFDNIIWNDNINSCIPIIKNILWYFVLDDNKVYNI